MTLLASFLNTPCTACCEDPVSSSTHLVGAVWFATLAKPLLQKADGRTGHKLALRIYVVSCVFLLSVSGIYHWFPPGLEREFLRRLDQAAIFLLIAGTFTPICGTMYRGATRWGSLSIVWSIALMGILYCLLFHDAISGRWGTGIFLGFGWLGGILAVELWHRETFDFVKPLIYGGLAYTGGTVLLESGHFLPLPRGISSHDLWHLAVLLGIGFHWQFISQIAGYPRLAKREASELARAFTSPYDPAQMCFLEIRSTNFEKRNPE